MSNPMAGWYPDPSGDPSRLRYWDGGTWTEHFADARPSGPAHAPATGGGAGGEGSPWRVPQESFSGSQQPSAYGYPAASLPGAEPSLVWAQDGASHPYGPGTGAPGGAPDGQGGGSQKGIVIGIVVGAFLLIAAVVVTAFVLLGADDDAPEPVSRPGATATSGAGDEGTTAGGAGTSGSAAPTGPELADGGALELGSPVSGSLPANGSWTATLTLAEPTVVVLDARSTSDEDLTLQLLGPDGFEETNDDRVSVFSDGTSDWRDPALGASLAAGEYEVVLTEYYDAASDFTVVATAVESVSIGVPVTADIPADGAWFAAVELGEDGVHVFDVVSADADPVLSLAGPDGDEQTSDDSSEGAGSSRDPYLRDLFPPGLYFIGLTEFTDSAATVELTVTAE